MSDAALTRVLNALRLETEQLCGAISARPIKKGTPPGTGSEAPFDLTPVLRGGLISQFTRRLRHWLGVEY